MSGFVESRQCGGVVGAIQNSGHDQVEHGCFDAPRGRHDARKPRLKMGDHGALAGQHLSLIHI